MAEVHGNRISSQNAGKTAIDVENGAESGALLVDSAENDADLQAIIEAWPSLPDDVKAGIMAIVRAAGR
jgi:hypothetical protein